MIDILLILLCMSGAHLDMIHQMILLFIYMYLVHFLCKCIH